MKGQLIFLWNKWKSPTCFKIFYIVFIYLPVLAEYTNSNVIIYAMQISCLQWEGSKRPSRLFLLLPSWSCPESLWAERQAGWVHGARKHYTWGCLQSLGSITLSPGRCCSGQGAPGRLLDTPLLPSEYGHFSRAPDCPRERGGKHLIGSY